MKTTAFRVVALALALAVVTGFEGWVLLHLQPTGLLFVFLAGCVGLATFAGSLALRLRCQMTERALGVPTFVVAVVGILLATTRHRYDLVLLLWNVLCAVFFASLTTSNAGGVELLAWFGIAVAWCAGLVSEGPIRYVCLSAVVGLALWLNRRQRTGNNNGVDSP